MAAELSAITAAINAVTTTANGALQRSGGTMTGAQTLAADPTTPLQPATKQYADSGLAIEAGARSTAITSLALAAMLTANYPTTPIPAVATTWAALTASTIVGSVGTRVPIGWFENKSDIAGVTASNAASAAFYASKGGGSMTVQSTAGKYLSAATTPAGGTTDAAFIYQQAANWIAAMNTIALAAGNAGVFELFVPAGFYAMHENILIPQTGNYRELWDKDAVFVFDTTGTIANACFHDGNSNTLPRPAGFSLRGGRVEKVGNWLYTDPVTGATELNGDPYKLTLTPSAIPPWSAVENVGAGWHRALANGVVVVANCKGTTGPIAPLVTGDLELGTAVQDGTVMWSLTTRPNVGGVLAAPVYIGTGTTAATSNATNYNGDIYYGWLDNITILDREIRKWSKGQAFALQGRGILIKDCKAVCPLGSAGGTGGFHMKSGLIRVQDCFCVSDDDGFQIVVPNNGYAPGSGWSGGNGNQGTEEIVFDNCTGASLQARFLICGMNLQFPANVATASLASAQLSPSDEMDFPPAAVGASGDLSGVSIGDAIAATAASFPTIIKYFPWPINYAFVQNITGNNASGWTVTATRPSLLAMPVNTHVTFVSGTPYGAFTCSQRAKAVNCRGYSGGGYGFEINQQDSQGVAYYAFDGLKLDCSGQGFQVACAGQGSTSSTVPFGSASNAWWISQAMTYPSAATLRVKIFDWTGANLLAGASGSVYVLSTSGSVGAGNFSIILADNNGPFTPSAPIPANCPVLFTLNGNNSAGANFIGGPYNGIEVSMANCEVFGAFAQSLTSNGNIRRFTDRASTFGAPQMPGKPFNLGGVVAGSLDDTLIYGTGADADCVAIIGTDPNTDIVGQVYPGICTNMSIRGVKLIGSPNATAGAAGLRIYSATNVHVERVTIIPGGVQTSVPNIADGIQLQVGATNCSVDKCDLSLLRGVRVSVSQVNGGGAPSGNVVGPGNIGNAAMGPVAAIGPNAPAAYSSAALSGSGSLAVPTLLPGAQLVAYETTINLADAALVAAGTITMPAIAAGDVPRTIILTTVFGVTSLSFAGTNVNWPGGGMAPGSGLTLKSNPATQKWTPANPSVSLTSDAFVSAVIAAIQGAPAT
ncbi:MAG: hypothetical protein WDN04_13300 [Rhodospirillales bacterium]